MNSSYTKVLPTNRLVYQQLHYIGVKLNKLEDALNRGATGRAHTLVEQIREHKSKAIKELNNAETE